MQPDFWIPASAGIAKKLFPGSKIRLLDPERGSPD
jgi:hypothetical protein